MGFNNANNVQFPKTWNGVIGRIRIEDQNRIKVYLKPGNNEDIIGNTNDVNLIKALFSAHINKMPISGFTNENLKIEWMDFKS